MMDVDVRYYSHSGEDFLLWQLFNSKPRGFYIDIGCFDGIYLNNSYFFEKQGWEGVCVEAHPSYFSRCKANRPRATSLHKACVGGGIKSAVTFYAEDLGLVSGLRKGEGKQISRLYETYDRPFSNYTEEEVGAITLNEIVRQYAPADKKIDFITIDTNGNELDILADFEFNNWFVRVFIINADDARANTAVHHMQNNGYFLARVLNNSCIFARNEESIRYLRYKKIYCRIAGAVHPLARNATHSDGRGRLIDDDSRWITPNVLVQQRQQPLWSLLDYFPRDPAEKKWGGKIVHMINPFAVKDNPVAAKNQQLTYDSMCAARDFYEATVRLVSVQHEDDGDLTPGGFERSRDLDRVVTEVARFDKPQPLPLLYDILERGAEVAGTDDFLIYTNSDIVLMPHFYSAVRDFIQCGFDAMNICRQTIGDHSLYQNKVNLARSEIGNSHPGSDCFVFSRKLFDEFVRDSSCIGKPGVSLSLLCNMAAVADRMLVLRNVNLTYHIGDERSWASETAFQYKAFNEYEYGKTYNKLCQHPEKKKLVTAFAETYYLPVNVRG